ncbi:MAG: 1,4-dihydroxy-2-naphthoate polyprenyltransferase [Flavobacteriaceae bacterium]
MSKTKAWLNAARLRTLPLSFSGIIAGSAMALDAGAFDLVIFVLALLTTLGFQVLSNFANDYGDGIKGTDNEERIGPKRALQSGLLTEKELKKGIAITVILTLILSIVLIYKAFGPDNLSYLILFFLLGIASIVAAIKYTVGVTAYGYRGLGDLFVFVFFGLLSVVGSFFLYTQNLSVFVFLPAITIGMLSTAVLNLNNMRDRVSDAKSGKKTLVVILGPEKSKKYHFALLICAYFAAFIFFYLSRGSYVRFLPLMAFIPILVHAKTVMFNRNPETLDPELKKIALSTFLFSVLFFITAVL